MAGYASVISLKRTINGLLNHPRISIVSPTREILNFVYNKATSLQQVLERSNGRIRSRRCWERLDALERQIRDWANKVEDALEFYELNSQDEEAIGQEITSFGETVKKMEKAYIEESSRGGGGGGDYDDDDAAAAAYDDDDADDDDDGGGDDDNDDDDDDDDDADAAVVSSDNDSAVGMVVSDSSEFNTIREYLLRGMGPDDLTFFAFLGQAGNGRTAIAKTLFEEGKQFFECWAWVTIGTIELKEVLIIIIAQVDKYDELLLVSDEKYSSKNLYRILENRRYMIVLDDVDDVELVNYLKQTSFPDQSNGSLVFLTTTSEEVAQQADRIMALKVYELNSRDEEVIGQEITSFGETAKKIEKMEKAYIEELSRDGDDDDAAIVSSNVDSAVEMVGYSRKFNDIRARLLRRMRPDDLCFYAVLGQVGSGRTVFAKRLFEDEGKQFFECWAWVTIGTKLELKEVLMSIIAQVDDINNPVVSREEDEMYLCKYLYRILERRRYMIVLDDVDDVELVNYLKQNSFPDQSNGSIVFLTTTSEEVVQQADIIFEIGPPASYFNEVMMDLMQGLFFSDKPMPADFEVAAKKIIHNCRCLRISSAKTLFFLIKTEKTVEQWSKIAADEENPIFMMADEISEINKLEIELQCFSREVVEFISACLHLPGKEVEDVKMAMFPERFFSRMRIMSFAGMAGIGKSAFAAKIFKDESILSHFDHHVWITLGPKYQTEEILIDILTQIYPDIHKSHMNGDDKLVRDLCVLLSRKRCLIVLDDLCSKEPLLHLKHLFPDIRGTTLVTTRIQNVAKFGRDDAAFEMHLLDKEDSWRLLRQKVFAGGLCPLELEKTGRKIAEKCDGLPLLILTVADQLLKVGMSQEKWNDVASGKEKSVFKNAHHQISEKLLPSYQSLPQHLKPCFLYIGVFREKYEITPFELANLWISEGFLEPNSSSQMEEEFVAECFHELVDRNLVMARSNIFGFIKTRRLHSVYWHLSNNQAMKNKFFHAMDSINDCSEESMESQRRLCIRNSILLGMKDVRDSMATNTSAHSLLCVNSLQQYPVPLNFDLRLLRVMNAITIRLYEFPIEVVRLVHLKFLGLTCNGELPTSISNLWKLQHLIVKRYMNIKSSKNSMPLPVEIWDMKELKHLEVMGGRLPDHECGAGLLKLSTLLDVSAQSCREEVLKWIPNLKILGIRIELAPDDEGTSFHYLNNISSHLCGLESLECVVVNPQMGSEVVAPPAPVSMFPSSLKRLSLSGLGYPWEYMSIIGELGNLEELELKHYAFQGPKWEMDCIRQFQNLQFLLVKDTNLVHWKINLGKLKCLGLKNCYKLKELSMGLGVSDKIEIVDCSPFTETWAEQLGEMRNGCRVNVKNTWSANTHHE